MCVRQQVWLIPIQHDALADKVCTSELQSDPNVSPSWLAEIRSLIQGTTHMYVAVVFFSLRNVDSGHSVPHYHVISHKMHEGVVSAVGAFIRKWVLEDVYRRIGAFGHSSSSDISVAY